MNVSAACVYSQAGLFVLIDAGRQLPYRQRQEAGMFERIAKWLERRREAELRRLLHIDDFAWELVEQISARRADRSPEITVSDLMRDGLRRRARRPMARRQARSLEDMADVLIDCSPIYRLALSTMGDAAKRSAFKVRVVQEGDEFVWLTPAADGKLVRVYPGAMPARITERMLWELRYLCGADMLIDDRAVSGVGRVWRDGLWRIEATFLPPGARGGLRAVLHAFPDTADGEPPHDEPPAQPVTRGTAGHYAWSGREGAPVCDGWRLMNSPGVSLVQERVPPGGSEERHSHAVTRQFFYVLSGTLTVEVDGTAHTLTAGQRIEVSPGTAHQVRNDSDAGDAEFLVVSNPGNSRADRIPEPA